MCVVLGVQLATTLVDDGVEVIKVCFPVSVLAVLDVPVHPRAFKQRRHGANSRDENQLVRPTAEDGSHVTRQKEAWMCQDARSQVQHIWEIHRRSDFLRCRHSAVVGVASDIRSAEALQLND
jgi:hypothetical protein